MPNKYVRKRHVRERGYWTAEALNNAINAHRNGEMGVNEAAKAFGIPKTTLKRRLKSNNLQKTNRLGPGASLGSDAEQKLVNHIKKLQKSGFAPTRTEVRIMAFNLAKRLGIPNKFNQTEGKAGKKWLELFLCRQPEISIRKSENTSMARSIGMSREAVEAHFADLERVITENSLFDKPGHIYNTDETGLQLNTRAGQVLAEKGSKSIPSISFGEKGETISVIACCNAEGGFIPPYCIFKGKNKKEEWLHGMPPGSQIKMSEKSAYVNGDIFLDWLKTQFLPRKPSGKVLLILDGHTSHTTNLDLLEFSEENDIIIFCLPAHTTHYLQPLDRAFFKSLKGNYYDTCRYMLRNNPKKVLNRLQFGKLLGEAWGKSATAQNAISAFKSTGILPYNPLAIPDYAFLNQNPVCTVQNQVINDTIQPRPDSPQPGPSGIQHQKSTPNKSIAADNITPGKALDEVCPVPVISLAVKRARKKISGELTSPEFIKNKKDKMMNTKKAGSKLVIKSVGKKIRKNKYCSGSSSSEDETGVVLLNDHSSGDEQFSDLENECVGCKEDYRLTKKKDEWLQCIFCKRWLHENCTSFTNLCQNCGHNLASKKHKQ